MNEDVMTERTYFLTLSGLDATNYLVIASKIKIAAHDDVQAQHLHFVDDLRSIIHLHKQSSRIENMDDLLSRLNAVGLRLCFRMWSMHSADELVRMALTEAESIDNEGNSDEAQQKSDSDGYGAIVAFLIVPNNLPVLIPDSGNSHCEICVTQVPDWESLQDELAGA